MFSDIDLASFLDALRDASWAWLAFALLLAQIPRLPSAVSTMGSMQQPLPLGPLTALQFAICYVNLAIPSTAARVAINVRFFQRFGVRPSTAISAGVIDSVSGFVVQFALFVLLFFASDADLGLSTDTERVERSGDDRPDRPRRARRARHRHRLRRPGAPAGLAVYREAKAALRVLRSPRKLLQLFGGNVASQILFAVALAACVEAFGVSVSLTELVLINTVVSLFAGLLPVPGGIGVTEAGLTLGLTAAGLSSEIAFAVALVLPLRQLLPAPDLGLVLLPLADQQALPVSASVRVGGVSHPPSTGSTCPSCNENC